MRLFYVLLAAALGALLLPAAPVAAQQNQRPAASTGGVSGISPTSANLNGSANPRGRPTEAFIRYGIGNNRPLSTPPTAIGSGTRPVPVNVAVNDLRPNTRYTYRLIARSSAGTSSGTVRSFKTPPAPPSVTLSVSTPLPVSPPTVPFGESIVLSGTVGGTGAAGSRVQPELRSSPFNTPFAPAGNALVAAADGAFNLQTTPQVTTDYRAVATVNGKTTVSPVVRVGVAPRVSLRLKRASKRRVRFRGNIEPGGDAIVRLIRVSKNGKNKTLKKTVTRGSELDSFKFGKRKVRRKSTDFIVSVTPANGAFVTGLSRVRTVRAQR